MTILVKRGLLIGALLATVVIRGAPIPPAGSTATAQEPGCPYGYFYMNGLCHPYSWAGPSVVTSSPGPALPPQ